jgi:membrane fusion protein (multidrug efflux system)
MPSEEPNRGNEAQARVKPDDPPPAVGITTPRRGDGRTPPDRPAPTSPPKRGHSLIKWLVIGGILIVVLPFALWIGIPWTIDALTTESTDDAYVNDYPTLVAPRVSGQVTDVFVKDNNRVKKRALLVRLDKQPYQIIVDLKRANLAKAKADLVATQDQTRAQVAQARSYRFKLEHTIEDVNNQVALLRANVAAWETTKARLARAKADYDRAKELEKTPGAISKQDVDLKLQDFQVAAAQVKQALEAVYQVRVGLGLSANPDLASNPKLPRLTAGAVGLMGSPLGPGPVLAASEVNSGTSDDLTLVPADLDQTFSTVRQAVGQMLESAAPLGIFPTTYNLNPKQVLEEFYRRDPQGDVDRIYAQVLRDAPAIKQAEAKVQEAEADLAQAELNLSYCDVYAEIDGVVTRRNINPGNNVQAGQSVMALRSPSEIWIDANFKETQLRKLRIGQRVRLEVDVYGSHRRFEGRITGFTMGTGQTLSLLPPQNATGNFVKIVQRLPVRIELTNYDPDKDPPLFIGTSVEPYVYIYEPPTGKDAGKVLQPYLTELPSNPKESVDLPSGQRRGAKP